MMVRPFLIPTVCALAALTTACDNNSVRISSTGAVDSEATGVLRVVEALQCPQTLGTLTRKGSATAQGTVCTYVGPRGAEVILHLVSLSDTDSTAALKAFEDRLSAAMPRASARIDESERDAAAAAAAADAAASSAEKASRAAEQAAEEADRASVRLPGISIEADGEDASVNIGGFNVEANDEGANIDIRSGGDSVSVQANDTATVVRTSAAGDATRANWILTDNRPSVEGWRLVGYEARGPAGGPIVVVTVRSKDREGGDVFDDAKELVTLNVGE
jgi:hypothetical protein